MSALVKKIGIMGEETEYVACDELARTTADNAAALAAELNTRTNLLAIEHGGTGAASVVDARAALEIHYDIQLLLGIYPGRNLAVVFAEEIAGYADEAEWFNARVVAGNFTGLRYFDYFEITLTDGKVFTYRMACIDPDLHAVDTEVTTHHVAMVPDQVWPDSVLWNTTNTNQGKSTEKHPYICSNLHTWEINTFYALLPQKWKNVIKPRRLLLEERYSASSSLTASTGWSWVDLGKIWSLSEFEVYGEVTWGTPGYSQGMDCHFAEFFKTTAHRIRRNFSDARYAWWLRSAYGSSSTYVCFVSNNGIARDSAATYSGLRPLPCFLVGV